MSSSLSSRKRFAIIAALIAIASGSISLTPSQAQQVVGYRAGTAGFAVGSAGITVTFSVPMPTAKYSVVVQPTNTAGYSPTPNCTYFNVLQKTTTKFSVQHKRCDNGAPVNLDVNVSLDWIAWSHN